LGVGDNNRFSLFVLLANYLVKMKDEWTAVSYHAGQGGAAVIASRRRRCKQE
jgi:hypothetical protein